MPVPQSWTISDGVTTKTLFIEWAGDLPEQFKSDVSIKHPIGSTKPVSVRGAYRARSGKVTHVVLPQATPAATIAAFQSDRDFLREGGVFTITNFMAESFSAIVMNVEPRWRGAVARIAFEYQEVRS